MLCDVSKLKTFTHNEVWKDMTAYLKEEIDRTQEELETCGPGTGVSIEEFPFKIVHLQTKLMVLKDMLDLPQILIDDIETSSGEEGRNELIRNSENPSE